MESDQGYEKKREARNDSRSFVLTNWNDGGAVDREEEGRRKQPGVCVREGEEAPELVVCEVPGRHRGGDAEHAAGGVGDGEVKFGVIRV